MLQDENSDFVQNENKSSNEKSTESKLISSSSLSKAIKSLRDRPLLALIIGFCIVGFCVCAACLIFLVVTNTLNKPPKFDDIPVYPGAKFSRHYSGSGSIDFGLKKIKISKYTNIRYHLPGHVATDEIASFYLNEMTSYGWTGEKVPLMEVGGLAVDTSDTLLRFEKDNEQIVCYIYIGSSVSGAQLIDIYRGVNEINGSGATTKSDDTPSPTAESQISSLPDTIGNWRISIVGVSELEQYGYYEPNEGYRIIGIELVIQNVGDTIERLSFYDLGKMYLEDDREFSYEILKPPGSDRPVDYFAPNILLPPNYRVKGLIAAQFPIVANGEKFVIETRNLGTKDFNLIDELAETPLKFPLPTNNYNTLGHPVKSNDVMSITPLEATLYQFGSGSLRSWYIYIRIDVENLHGYDQSINIAQMQIFDGLGHVFEMPYLSSLYMPPPSLTAFNNALSIIPPGFISSGMVEARVSDYLYQSYDGEDVGWPTKPTNLKLLIALPIANDDNTDPSWIFSVYDLGEPEILDKNIERGHEIAYNYGCLNCHSVDGTSGEGPTFLGMADSEKTTNDGNVIVIDNEYMLFLFSKSSPDELHKYFGINADDLEKVISFIVSLGTD